MSFWVSLGLKLLVLLVNFDPNFHEAVEMVDGEKSGVVVEEVSKGYIKSGKLIRPTKVKVIK